MALVHVLFATSKLGVPCEGVEVVSVTRATRALEERAGDQAGEAGQEGNEGKEGQGERQSRRALVASSGTVLFLVTSNTAASPTSALSSKLLTALNRFLLPQLKRSKNQLLLQSSAIAVSSIGIPTAEPTAIPTLLPSPVPTTAPTPTATPPPRWTLSGLSLYIGAGCLVLLIGLCLGYGAYMLNYFDTKGKRLPRQARNKVVPVEAPPWGDDCAPPADSPHRRKKKLDASRAMAVHNVKVHAADAPGHGLTDDDDQEQQQEEERFELFSRQRPGGGGAGSPEGSRGSPGGASSGGASRRKAKRERQGPSPLRLLKVSTLS